VSNSQRFCTILAVALLGATLPLHAAIDSTLFTNYTLNSPHTSIEWVVCGSLPGSDGCYGAGSLGPFGRVGAMIEGNPSINLAKGTVTRYIYVLDVAAGAAADLVALSIYKKVDTIVGSSDSITVTAFKTVVLPLTGGASTEASMAANNLFVYIGTNQDPSAVQLKKSNFAITQFSVISGSPTVSSITANKYGFVTVTWGSSDGTSGFEVLDPTGRPQEDGGGAPFMMNTMQATLPAALP